MNLVVLIGRMTRDCEFKEGTTNVARFSLAVDRKFAKKDAEQKADFINCVAFGKTADFFRNYTHQGTKLAVTGRIQTGSYTNRDGKKVSTTDIIVDSAEFCESKQASESAAPATPPKTNDGFMSVDPVEDEGLPFNA